MFEVAGYLGGACLAVCAVPQVYKTFRTRSAEDLDWGFLGLWFGGELFCVIYVVEQNIRLSEYQLPLILNYLFNILLIVALIYGKVAFKKK